MVLGLVLAALELISPGTFFIIFFGVGALVVGVLTLFNLAGPVWVQWLLFSVISVLALLLFRNPLLRLMRADPSTHTAVDSLTNDIATALDDIPPAEMGRAELRGSAWTARNAGTTPIKKGQRCVVQRVEGLKLHIVPEGVR
jgi:inner membrane protein